MEAPDFFVEDLLDLPNGDEMMPDAFFDTSSAVHSCNSFFSAGTDHHLLSDLPNPHAPELCVPYEDMAELEWLSNFVEESFSSEGAFKAVHQQQQSSSAVPGRVRSKLARVAPSDWSTRVLMVSEAKKPASRRRGENPDSTKDGEVRRCLHCAAEKTPQWRTGPMGPKTLCNACGVRYKSGRLVPEYRPAASPTFVSARHSNSHRKVMELRRQKDVVHSSRQQPHFRGEASAPGVYVGSGGEDFLIHHHHMGTDYRQLI